jgi:hypothetical protein
MTPRTWLIVVLAVLLALPASAGASTLSIVEDELRFAADAGEINSISFALQLQLGYTLQDAGGAPMTQVAPCTPWAVGYGTGGICPPDNVERVSAVLGDGPDSWGSPGLVPVPLRLFAGAGNDQLMGSRFGDTLVGGAGEDEIEAGDGDDAIDVLDGQRDVVHCGAGNDTVTRDAHDVLDADCEQQPPAGGEQFHAYASWLKAFRLRHALRSGVPLQVECTAACRARATLALRGKRAHRGRVVATADEALAGGEHVLRVRFSQRGRRILRRYGAVALKLDLKVDPASGGAGERFDGRVQLRG